MIQGEISYPQTKLTHDILGKDGCFLSDFIQRQGDNPPLKEINLWPYSMPESKWTELFRFTSTCKYLTRLDLRRCKVGESGRYLAQSNTSWGDDPPLQKLNLRWCSIPEQVWAEVLQSLSSCKQLSDLDLSHNTIGEAGHYLAQSIASWGDNPPLEKLYLGSCSLPEQVWAEVLQSLSSCKQLTDLGLSNNIIGEAGRYLTQSITSWGDNSSLQKLDLSHCSIPEQVWPDLLQSLSYCKQLTDLRLSNNIIGEAGRYLTQSITSWGDNPPLRCLYLNGCSIPAQVWAEFLQSLSSCGRLKEMYLSCNTLTGCLSSFLSEPNAGLTSLYHLELEQTALNKSDIQHLTHLIQTKKLSGFKGLWLEEESWTDVEDELLQLKKTSDKKICLNLPKPLRKKYKQVQMTHPFHKH